MLVKASVHYRPEVPTYKSVSEYQGRPGQKLINDTNKPRDVTSPLSDGTDVWPRSRSGSSGAEKIK